MNDVEKMLLEQKEADTFQRVVTCTFDFADSLIEQSDLDRINNKEDNV